MEVPEFSVAIPARYGASRLPGKPLRKLAGEPLLVHVVRRALAAQPSEVIVATDDPRIAEAVAGLPVTVCMTAAAHASGSDRIAECARQLGWPDERIIVNLQGDEPFAPPEGIRAVAACLAGSRASIATLASEFVDPAIAFDADAVKVVVDASGHALYFSRAPLPWHRDRFRNDRLSSLPVPGLRHIGIYAYRAGFLARFAALPRGRLETAESLEQLRALEAGERIAVALSPVPFPPGVDTECDLERAERRLRDGDD